MTQYTELLQHIDPADLSYEEWLAVGMALHHEGGTAQEWDTWSLRDSARYHVGECARKWAGFHGNGVTMGTLVEYARRQGWRPPVAEGRAYDWDECVSEPSEKPIVDLSWLEDADVQEPAGDWNGADELSRYLSALFESSEYVGYVMQSWVKDDRHLPQKGSWTRTAGELLADLARYGNIEEALGTPDPEAGAWIRFNPLDGQGIKDSNVTAFRYALVESDSLPIERQAAIYKELELPVAALVHSGGKSLHAIVRIDATTMAEYRERVNYLHDICKKNGLEIDTQNRNPSRLSRLPGVWRNGQKQFLVGLAQGQPTFEAWKEWVEEQNDQLPDFEPLADVFADLPPLAPPIIDGVLREGHKMLLAGPSKAGKSYMLLQLVIAIAEGREWLGWPCRQGRVLYVNLELDRASCLHRLAHLYETLGIPAANVGNIDLWNLRGRAVPMDQLAPKLIRRAVKRGYKAVIIDPIYKVITGDENAADKMAFFCNQFDRVCAELGSAVIYCHHHSKGAQGGKASRDRSSGSGVFARDPDALLDLIELAVPDNLRKTATDRAICDMLSAELDKAAPGWRSAVSQDDALVAAKLAQEARRLLGAESGIDDDIGALTASLARQTAWRIEGTLREFAPFKPRGLWFRHPVHVADVDDALQDAKADGEEPPWMKGRKDKKEAAKDRRAERLEALEAAFAAVTFDGTATLERLADHMGIQPRTVRERVNEHAGFAVKNGEVVQCGSN